MEQLESRPFENDRWGVSSYSSLALTSFDALQSRKKSSISSFLISQPVFLIIKHSSAS